MSDTFTTEHRTKLEQYLAEHELPSGLGSEQSACSIAAINLALSGELTDDIPACMSKVLGRTTIKLQDEMSYEMRNSSRYKKLLPDMAGTGREHEEERLTILLDWMWSVVLPKLQPLANEYGFGTEWRNMCQKKTSAAAYAAHTAAARTAAHTVDTAAYAAAAAYDAAHTVDTAAYAASAAARAAAHAAYAADAPINFWQDVDPIGVLERMTFLERDR